MKKRNLLITMLALFFTSILHAASFSGGQSFYLKPNANWLSSNARFAVYMWNSGGNTWEDMTKVKDGVYKVVIPSGTWDNLIFCRMNPAEAANTWDNKWTQTGDLVFDGTKNVYKIADGDWGGTDANWQVSFLSVNDTDLSILPANSLNGLAAVSVSTGVSSLSNLEKLGDAIGNNTAITVVSISGIIPTNWGSEYFSGCTNENFEITVDADLSLVDKTNVNLPKNIQMASGKTVTYTRQAHIDGGWETLVLPFDCSVLPVGFKFEAFIGTTKDGDDNVSLNFETATSLTANQPYIMRYTTPAPGATAADVQEVSFSADHLWTNADATAAVVGVYQSMVIAQQTLATGTKYILNADGSSFVLVTANDVTVEPYRAYLDANNIAGASLAPKFSILHNGEGGTTGVSAQTTDELKVTAVRGGLLIRASKTMPISICTIDGRMVLRRTLEAGETSIYGLSQGIYIVNQQKLIIK